MTNPLPAAARVALLVKPGAALEVRTVTVPGPAAGEVLVQVEACTLCGSDLHSIEGRRSCPLPLLAGHEILGHVVALGPQLGGAAPKLQVGDRVVWSVTASCGNCFYCGRGLPQKCERLMKYGHESQDEVPLSGGLGEYVLLRAGTTIVRVPEEVSWKTLCPASCATSTAIAALRAAGDLRGAHVVVCGAGMLGITAMAIASTRGAASVIAVDIDGHRLRLAEQFGATRTVLADNGLEQVTAVIEQSSGGRGADLVFEMTGAPEVMQSTLDWPRIGGRLILVGAVAPVGTVAWDPERIVRRMLTIRGVHNYAPADLEEAVQFLSTYKDRFDWPSLVDQECSLDDVNRALGLDGAERTSVGNGLRVAVRP